MIVNSINSLNTNRNYSIQNTSVSEPAFGGTAQQGQKIGKKAVLAAMALAALIPTVALTACGSPSGGSTTPVEEPESPVTPVAPETPVAPVTPTEPTAPTLSRQAMDEMIEMLEVLGLKQSVSLSARAVDTNYIAVKGDIKNLRYQTSNGRLTTSFNLDTINSTSDKIAYNEQVTNNATGKVNDYTMTIAKSQDGIIVTHSYDGGYSYEYIKKDNSLLVKQITSEGIKSDYHILKADGNGNIQICDPATGNPWSETSFYKNISLLLAD